MQTRRDSWDALRARHLTLSHDRRFISSYSSIENRRSAPDRREHGFDHGRCTSIGPGAPRSIRPSSLGMASWVGDVRSPESSDPTKRNDTLCLRGMSTENLTTRQTRSTQSQCQGVSEAHPPSGEAFSGFRRAESPGAFQQPFQGFAVSDHKASRAGLASKSAQARGVGSAPSHHPAPARRPAFDLADRSGDRTVYDGLYLALAVRLGFRLNSDSLVAIRPAMPSAAR